MNWTQWLIALLAGAAACALLVALILRMRNWLDDRNRRAMGLPPWHSTLEPAGSRHDD